MDAKVVVESHMDTGLSITESKIDVEPETIEFKDNANTIKAI